MSFLRCLSLTKRASATFIAKVEGVVPKLFPGASPSDPLKPPHSSQPSQSKICSVVPEQRAVILATFFDFETLPNINPSVWDTLRNDLLQGLGDF